MVKLLRGGRLELVAMAGIDPGSDGLERARRLGVATTHEGLDGLRTMPGYADVGLVFDATSAPPPARHAQLPTADGKQPPHLTPPARGPHSLPGVHLAKPHSTPPPTTAQSQRQP